MLYILSYCVLYLDLIVFCILTCSVPYVDMFYLVLFMFQHLKSQQEGIQQLINVIKEDLMDLTIIDQGWQEAAIQHKR